MLWSSCLQETERDELLQAKDRELAQIQQQLRQLRQKVIFILYGGRGGMWLCCGPPAYRR